MKGLSEWGERLRCARDALFVGRVAECARFEAFLRDDSALLLHVYGPAGIGKSTLLRRFMSIAGNEGWRVSLVDGHREPAEPEAIRAALPELGPDPHLIAFDSFERLRLVESWLRTDLLSSLPDSVRVVTAGRSGLGDRWTRDAGWRDVAQAMLLGDLDGPSAEDYLRRRGVPEPRIAEVVHFSRGHPLTLHLASELVLSDPDRKLDVARSRQALKPLFDRYLGEVPTREHREALYASALVSRTTEPLLAAMLDVVDASPVFDWLCDRPFMEVRDQGISPHDLLRDILAADLKWRDPLLQQRLIERATGFYIARFDDCSGGPEALARLYFLLRQTPAGRLYHQGDLREDVYVDRATTIDLPRLVDMVSVHEGRASAEIAEYWQRRQPGGISVLRDADAEPVGFLHFVDIGDDASLEEAEAADPLMRGVRAYLDEAPLRTGELARICRFWMAADGHQGPTSLQLRIFSEHWQKLTLAAEVSLALCVYAPAEAWLTRTDALVKHYPKLDFEVGAMRHAVFGFDWRKAPRSYQMRRFHVMMRGDPLGEPDEVYAVLGHDVFADAVKRALRAYWRPLRLRASPLLRSRIVVDRAGWEADLEARLEALRSLLVEACRALGEEPGTERHAAALDLAYFRPDLKGLAAADELGMPFSTYRYYVGRGVELVIAALWHRELGQASFPDPEA